MTEEKKAYYENKVCSVCANNETCNKDKFVSTSIYDRLSIKCMTYEYKNKES